jgi:hypothetical protein
MEPAFQHLHTYFLFPFSIDKQAVSEDHQSIWGKHLHWIDGVEEWFAAKPYEPGARLVAALGGWQRQAYRSYTLEDPAYQDMVFFHPFVRRVFFDSSECGAAADMDPLLNVYQIPVEGRGVFFEAEDAKGRGARVAVTDLRLFMFANGIGILSIGVEAHDIAVSHGLWINEMMRKIYPSSHRQLREGRMPRRLALTMERATGVEVLAEETFREAVMVGFQPPLARTLQALLYFADYKQLEYEPVLDERMVVYSYASIDPNTVPADFTTSEDYRVLLSRLLYVDRYGPGYRYDPTFVAGELYRQVYRRWAHQGTFYGFTSYSNITVTLGLFDCDEHELREGFLIHRMFTTRYFLMAMVTLFYRATLLDFAERTAMVSRLLYQDQQSGRITTSNIRIANELRTDFLHFSNYWYFDELANKDEENEHFLMQVREYHIDSMKREIEEEVDKLNQSLHTYYQFRNTESINRLAMLSLILGAGAVVTGFFGMNFEGLFEALFFKADQQNPAHWSAVIFVSVFAFATLSFGLYVVISNWQDYRESLLPRWWLNRRAKRLRSLRRG